MLVKSILNPRGMSTTKRTCAACWTSTAKLIALANSVGKEQLRNIRKGLQGHSVLFMGENTLMQGCVKVHAEKIGNQAFLSLLPLIVGNVGLIFTKGDLKEVGEEVAKYKDSSKFAVTAAPAASTIPVVAAAPTFTVEEKKEELAEESDDVKFH